MTASMTYVAKDGTRLDFTVPKGVNRALVARSIRRVHQGAIVDAVLSPLTHAERDLVVEIVGSLEDHAPTQAV